MYTDNRKRQDTEQYQVPKHASNGIFQQISLSNEYIIPCAGVGVRGLYGRNKDAQAYLKLHCCALCTFGYETNRTVGSFASYSGRSGHG